MNQASFVGGKILLTGSGLNTILGLEGKSSNLENYLLQIESKDTNSMTISISHPSLSTLNLAIGAVLTIALNTAQAQVTVNLTVDSTPAGAISAFNLASCPAGWSEFTAGKGRVLVGSGAGNTDSKGDALTTRTLAETGGLEYTSGIPAVNSFDYTGTVQDVDWSFTDAGPEFELFTGLLTSGGSIFVKKTPDNTYSGVKANSNLPPYVVVKYCVKN